MLTTKKKVVFLAVLLCTLAYLSFGANADASASTTPTLTKVGKLTAPVSSASGKTFCDYANFSGGVPTVRYHFRDVNGIQRETNLINQTEVGVGQYLGYGLACLDNGAFYIVSDYYYDMTVWQSGATHDTAKVLLSPNQTIATDKGNFTYQGDGLIALVHNGHLVLVTGEFTVEFIPGGTNHTVVPDFGERYVENACITGDGTLFTLDWNTGNYERWTAGGSVILEQVSYSSYYTFNCGPTKAWLAFDNVLSEANATSSSHHTLGNSIAGSLASEPNQMLVDQNDNPFWAVETPSPANIAEGMIVSFNGTSAYTVYKPTLAKDLILVLLTNGLGYYPTPDTEIQ